MNLLPEHSVFVAGHFGMVGRSLMRALQRRRQAKIISIRRAELDLTQQQPVERFLAARKPDIIVIAAARVGGIHANSRYPAEFMYDNLMIAANVIHAAHRVGVRRLLFLGSSCIYPRLAPQPMSEGCLLASPLEKTNEAYALAKIAGLKLCQFYREQYGSLFHSVMPTNLYGPGDNYHSENSHVIPGLIRRFHEAKISNSEEVVVWGTGTPRREFLHVDDLADACLHLLQIENPPDWVNVGSGDEVTIGELASLIKEVVGFAGKLRFDPSKPDGTPRKLVDVSLLNSLGWRAKTALRSGLVEAYEDFKSSLASSTVRG